jgi:putative NADH-flavin reductase
MKIGIIGATGKAGSLIIREAAGRGHEVTAIIRPGSIQRLEGAYKVLERDIFDIKAEDLRDFDAVVNAFGTPFNKPGKEYQYQTSMESLIREMEKIPELRLLCVGGASSLWEDQTMKLRVLERIPADFRVVPENAFKAFEKLKASRANWTYLSPPKNFDPGGARSGKYFQGTDFVILNTAGESYASYADYAIAMVDEIENKAYIRRRFTIVSDSPFFQDSKRLYSLASYPFFRAGGYLGVFLSPAGNDAYGAADPYIGSRRGMAAVSDQRLVDLRPIYRGRELPCAVQATATELTLRTRYGNLYFCFAEPSLLLIRGDPGMGIRIFKNAMESNKFMKPHGPSVWETMHRFVGTLTYKVLKGKGLMDAKWNYDQTTTPYGEIVISPETDEGVILAAVEESRWGGAARDSYPSYEEGLKSVQKEWTEFLDSIPELPGGFGEKREAAAYALWSHIVGPSGHIKRPLLYMFPNEPASSWQQWFNALALGIKDLKLAMELMINPIDAQSPTGQIPHAYDDSRFNAPQPKPCINGWALKVLMKKHDLVKEVPREKLEYLYRGFGKWADWYLKYRDDDKSGLPQCDCGPESGTDDASCFKVHNQIKTPDLAAYLALCFEAQGDLAKMLGKSAEEAEAWYGKSKNLIDLLIKKMWKGDRWVALVNGTHEEIATGSSLYYQTIVLGKRLPQGIIDKMAEDLSVEGAWLTPYGIATENLSTSNDVSLGMHMSLAYILPSAQMLICTGLYDAGKTELAKKIARRYCGTIKDGGFIMLVNPFNGMAGRPGGSWAACAYIFLADMLNW